MIRWRKATPVQQPKSIQSFVGSLSIRVEGDTAYVDVRGRESLEALYRDASATATVARLRLVVHGWKPIAKSWSGKSGALPGLTRLSFEVNAGDAKTQCATIEIESSIDATVWEFARAAYPLLYPLRRRYSTVSPRVVFDRDVDESMRFASPETMTRPIIVTPKVGSLLTNDLVVAGADVDHESVDSAKVLRWEPHETAMSLPSFNIRVYNPFHRLDRGKQGMAATLSLPSPRALELHTEDGLLKKVPTGAPLGRTVMAALRKVEHVDLSQLRLDESVEHNALRSRLVEMAASGVVLHGLNTAGPVGGFDDGLRVLMQAAYGQPSWLQRDARSQAQSRSAMRGHSQQWAASPGRGASASPPSVSVLLSTRRSNELAAVLEAIANQTYPNIEVLIACHGCPAPDLSQLSEAARAPIARIVEISGDVVFGAVMGQLTAMASGELLVKMDDDDLYGPEHLWDLVLAHSFSEAEVVGKLPDRVFIEDVNIAAFLHHRSEYYAKSVAGGTMLMSTADVRSVGGWRPLEQAIDRGLIDRFKADGGLIYATSSIGFVYVRHGRGHTWSTDEQRFLDKAVEQAQGVPALALGIGVCEAVSTQ